MPDRPPTRSSGPLRPTTFPRTDWKRGQFGLPPFEGQQNLDNQVQWAARSASKAWAAAGADSTGAAWDARGDMGFILAVADFSLGINIWRRDDDTVTRLRPKTLTEWRERTEPYIDEAYNLAAPIYACHATPPTLEQARAFVRGALDQSYMDLADSTGAISPEEWATLTSYSTEALGKYAARAGDVKLVTRTVQYCSAGTAKRIINNVAHRSNGAVPTYEERVTHANKRRAAASAGSKANEHPAATAPPLPHTSCSRRTPHTPSDVSPGSALSPPSSSQPVAAMRRATSWSSAPAVSSPPASPHQHQYITPANTSLQPRAVPHVINSL